MMKHVIWKSIENKLGLEHLCFRHDHDGITVHSVVIGERSGNRFGLRYALRCTPAWQTLELKMDLMDGSSLHLLSDGNGNWRHAGGAARPDLTGCIDVDISATPFTNTLPIRRLNLAPDERQMIRVVYIPVPALKAEPVEQAYTCLLPDKRYRYEGIFRHFQAELDVDEDGLVIDYPTLFTREFPLKTMKEKS